jgi:hypothetical protein
MLAFIGFYLEINAGFQESARNKPFKTPWSHAITEAASLGPLCAEIRVLSQGGPCGCMVGGGDRLFSRELRFSPVTCGARGGTGG